MSTSILGLARMVHPCAMPRLVTSPLFLKRGVIDSIDYMYRHFSTASEDTYKVEASLVNLTGVTRELHLFLQSMGNVQWLFFSAGAASQLLLTIEEATATLQLVLRRLPKNDDQPKLTTVIEHYILRLRQLGGRLHRDYSEAQGSTKHRQIMNSFREEAAQSLSDNRESWK